MLDEENAALAGEMDPLCGFFHRQSQTSRTLLPTSDFESAERKSPTKTYLTYPRGNGAPRTCPPEEVRFLSIPRAPGRRGAPPKLNRMCWQQLQFLAQIPWTEEFGGIPEIARAHHEKLNGKGYPFGLNSNQISHSGED